MGGIPVAVSPPSPTQCGAPNQASPSTCKQTGSLIWGCGSHISFRHSQNCPQLVFTIPRSLSPLTAQQCCIRIHGITLINIYWGQDSSTEPTYSRRDSLWMGYGYITLNQNEQRGEWGTPPSESDCRLQLDKMRKIHIYNQGTDCLLVRCCCSCSLLSIVL